MPKFNSLVIALPVAAAFSFAVTLDAVAEEAVLRTGICQCKEEVSLPAPAPWLPSRLPLFATGLGRMLRSASAGAGERKCSDGLYFYLLRTYSHTLIRMSPRPWMSSKSSTVSAQTPRSSVRGPLGFCS